MATTLAATPTTETTTAAALYHGDVEQGIIITPHRRSCGDGDEEIDRSSVDETTSSGVASSTKECEALDLECGGNEEEEEAVVESGKVGVHLSKAETDCRICHLSLDGSNLESGFPIELGCSCKGDLAAAHKHCAEAWFKIRGNKTCEICGSTARNVVGVNEVEMMEQWSEANDTTSTAAVAPHPAETRHFWQGHKFLNFLLACMVFAFVISWLFHFNVPS